MIDFAQGLLKFVNFLTGIFESIANLINTANGKPTEYPDPFGLSN